MFQEDEPGFFKYIVSMALTERLVLPPAHHWNKQRNFPDRVILKDQNGNGWLVKVEKVGNNVCFVDGWLKFVEENNVKLKDFIVFEYLSPNIYSFLLLDSQTACETGGFTGSKEDSATEISTFDELNLEEESEEEEEEYEEEEEEEDSEEEKDDDYVLETEHIREIGSTSGRRKKRNPVFNYRRYDIYGDYFIQTGMFQRPNNPFFFTRRRGTRNDELFIPKDVIVTYGLRLPKKTIMRDIDGTEWATELNRWGDGRYWYYGGWGNFCRKNFIQENDNCVCEFIIQPGNGLTLLVYKFDP